MIDMALPQQIKTSQRKSLARSEQAIVNAYSFIAAVYCLSSTLLFYTTAHNRFLAGVHLLALVTVIINYSLLKRTGHFKRATHVILTTGTTVVLSLFATGGWANTGYLWPFAYLPFVFFLASGNDIIYWSILLFAGCLLLVALHAAKLISIPYSPIALGNYFAALVVFMACLYFFRQASRKSEEALRDSEGQVQTIFNAAPDAVIVMNQHGAIVQWNPKAEALFGWKAEEVTGKALSETIIPHRFREAHRRGMERFLETGVGPVLNTTIEVRALDKRGTEFDVALSISPTQVREGYLFIGFVRDITLQKKADEQIRHLNATLEQRIVERTEELHSSESKYRELFQNNPMPMWVIEAVSFRFLNVNEAAIRYYGYSREEFLTMTAIDIRPEEDRTSFVHLNRQGKTSSFYTGYWRHRKKDGTIISVEVSSDEISFEGKKARLVLSNDITDRVKAEAELRESLKEVSDYKYALDESSIVAITDQKGTIKYVNDKFIKISKYNWDELIGQDHRLINSGYHPKEFIRHLWVTIANGKIWRGEIKNKAKDGSYYWVDTTIVPFLDERGKPYQYIAIRVDITERKKTEEELKKVELSYSSLVEQASDGIFICDEDRNYIDVNIRTCELMGYSKEEMLHMNAADHSTAEDNASWDARKRILQAGITMISERKMQHKNGRWLDMEVSVKKLPDNRLMGILRDIGDRKKAEQEIKELNETLEKKVEGRTSQLEAANKELEAFTYSVSHDLRAPLRIIDGYANILVDDYALTLDKEGHRILGIIMNNARRMGELIDDLLNLSRLGRKELTLQAIDMEALVRPVIAELLSLNAHPPEITVGPLEPAECDGNLIRQVWGNLISNAIKYSGTRDQPVVEIGSWETSAEIIYFVKDNGVGFDMQYAHKLFGVFQRLHKMSEFEGTGVGLALVQRIVNRHGGRVWAEAETDKGACFYFSLPVKTPSNQTDRYV